MVSRFDAQISATSASGGTLATPDRMFGPDRMADSRVLDRIRGAVGCIVLYGRQNKFNYFASPKTDYSRSKYAKNVRLFVLQGCALPCRCALLR